LVFFLPLIPLVHPFPQKFASYSRSVFSARARFFLYFFSSFC
jgi:hypothetical protein